jgi:hypothetical protein
MNTTNISHSIDRKLLIQIDSERGDIPRSRYMNKLIKEALIEKSVSIGKDSSLSQ